MAELGTFDPARHDVGEEVDDECAVAGLFADDVGDGGRLPLRCCFCCCIRHMCYCRGGMGVCQEGDSHRRGHREKGDCLNQDLGQIGGGMAGLGSRGWVPVVTGTTVVGGWFPYAAPGRAGFKPAPTGAVAVKYAPTRGKRGRLHGNHPCRLRPAHQGDENGVVCWHGRGRPRPRSLGARDDIARWPGATS